MNETIFPFYLGLAERAVTGGVLLLGAILGVSLLFFTRRDQWSGFARNTVLGKAPGLNILQRYMMAEVFPPIIVSAQALSSFFIVKVIYSLISLLMAHGSLDLVLEILVASMPTVLSLTIPIAILLGTLLSVGRLAVDNEIRAMQTAGVNIFRVFWPMLALSGILCCLMIFVNYFYAPKLVRRVDYLKTSLLFEALSSLPAGIPNDQYELGEGAKMTFYFREREPGTGDMMRISMMVEHKFEKQVKVSEEEARKKDKAQKRKKEREQGGKSASVSWFGSAWAADPGERTEEEKARYRKAQAEKAAGGVPGPARLGNQEAGETKPDGKPGTDEKSTDAAGEPATEGGAIAKVDRTNTKRVARHELILASRGHVEIDEANQLIYLHLIDGSIHSIGEDLDGEEIAAEMAEKAQKAKEELKKATGSSDATAYAKDVPVTFEKLTKPIKITTDKPGKEVTEYTVIDMMKAIPLRKEWPPWRNETQQEIDKNIRKLKVELCNRTAIPMACVSFCLIGAALAIFVRPSGKSVGVIITFGLILIYYWMIKWGSSTAEQGRVIGYFIIFLPNLLMGGIGAFLMRKAINQ